MAKTRTELGLFDLSSDVPPVEASCGQDQNWIRSGWLVEAAQVSFTFVQPLGQADFQVRHTPIEASSGQELVLHKISFTFGQPLGQADLQS